MMCYFASLIDLAASLNDLVYFAIDLTMSYLLVVKHWVDKNKYYV